MARLKRFVHRLLRRPDGRRVLAGVSVGAAAFLWAFSAQGAGIPPADPHINTWAWDEHAPPVGWFIVDFIIFVFILVKLTKGPLEKTFAARHESIKKSIVDATSRFHKATSMREDYQSKLANIDDESSRLMAESKAEGGTTRDGLLAEAQSYADKLRADSSRLQERELVLAQGRLQVETVTRALQKAETILQGQLNSEDHERLIEKAILDLETQVSMGGAQ